MKTPKFEAEFSSLGNDLFWKFCPPIFWTKDTQIIPNDAILRWVGYDDDNWWNNVAPERAQRTDKIGNVWQLNFETCEVLLVKKKRGAHL